MRLKPWRQQICCIPTRWLRTRTRVRSGSTKWAPLVCVVGHMLVVVDQVGAVYTYRGHVPKSVAVALGPVGVCVCVDGQ